MDSPRETRQDITGIVRLRVIIFVDPLRPSGAQQTLWSDEIHRPRIFWHLAYFLFIPGNEKGNTRGEEISD